MGNKIIIMVCFFIFGFAFHGQAQKVSSQTGVIEVVSPKGKELFHYAPKNKTLKSVLQRWQVDDTAQKLSDEDNIYRDRHKKLYQRRIKLMDRTGQGRNRLFEFVTDKKNEEILISPQEDFLLHRAISPMSEDVIYSWDLFSVRQFVIDYASNFNMTTCRNKKTYVMVKKNKPESVYIVYDLYGNKIRTLKSKGDYDLIEKALCE